LISVSGYYSNSTPSGRYYYKEENNISSKDSIITINRFKVARNPNTYVLDTTSSNENYTYQVFMKINSNMLIQIIEKTTKLSTSSIVTGTIYSYWSYSINTSNQCIYNLNLSFLEPEPVNFKSLLFYQSDLAVSMSEFDSNKPLQLKAVFI